MLPNQRKDIRQHGYPKNYIEAIVKQQQKNWAAVDEHVCSQS